MCVPCVMVTFVMRNLYLYTTCLNSFFSFPPSLTLLPFLFYKVLFPLCFFDFFGTILGFIWRKCHIQAYSVYWKTFMHYEVFFPGSRRMFTVVSTLEKHITTTNLGVNGLQAKFSSLDRLCYNLFRSLRKPGTGRKYFLSK